MSIQTVGGINQILKNHQSHEWSKSADMDLEKLGSSLSGSMDGIGKTEGNKSFSEMLATSISEVNGLQQEANLAIQKLATGQTKNLHETMLTVEKAEIAFRTMNQVRMKVLDAYKEIMRMQL